MAHHQDRSLSASHPHVYLKRRNEHRWNPHQHTWPWLWFCFPNVSVLPSSFPIFESSLLADFKCRYKSRLKGTRESFSLDFQGRETNISEYDKTIRLALSNTRSGLCFATCGEFLLSSSLSLWFLSSSSITFSDTRSSDVMLTFLFEIHQILWQPTILTKSIGTVHGRWLYTQSLLTPKLRNPASPLALSKLMKILKNKRPQQQWKFYCAFFLFNHVRSILQNSLIFIQHS